MRPSVVGQGDLGISSRAQSWVRQLPYVGRLNPYDQQVSLTEQLRARGLRVTSARAHVLEAVQQLEHCTPEQIYQHVGQDSPSLNITTVYRTLDLLEELGLIGHTHLGHGAPVYHLAEDQHLHVVCHRCESVISAESSVLTDVVATMEREHGFRVDVGHVTLSGECASCRAGSE